MPSKSKKESNQRLLSYKKFIWECIRRNEGYKKTFDKLEALRHKKGTKGRQEQAVKYLEIARYYRLSVPHDYKLDFNDAISHSIELGWIKAPNQTLMSPIAESSLKVIDTLEGGYPPPIRFAKKSEFLEDGRYLHLVLDVSQPKEIALLLAGEAIDLAVGSLDSDMEWGPQRLHETDLQLFIWDKKSSGLTFEEIGQLLIDEKQVRKNVDLESATKLAKYHHERANSYIQSIPVLKPQILPEEPEK
ncbi:hypothetical protein K1X76_10115 [bacterium]|nr:hypothetical protein [bacterium]